MAYAAPTSDAVDFAMVTGYTPPLASVVDFAFNPVTGLPELRIGGVLITNLVLTDSFGVAIPGLTVYYGSTQVF